MWSAENMFLNGPFHPAPDELTVQDLEVQGVLPADLNGVLYRVGSNQVFEPPVPSKYHWFDGDGMVVAITLAGGKASIRSRFVETAGLKAERDAGQALYGSFMNGGPPPRPHPGAPPFKVPANTNVLAFGRRLLVFCEADVPHELHPETLETLGLFDFGGVRGPVTAHFKVDPANGDLLFFGAMGTQAAWYRADSNGALLETVRFELGVPSFIHDFAVTDDYALFFVNPSLVSFENVMRGGPSTVWSPDVGNRVILLERATGSLRVLEMDDVFAPTHFLNAYRDGDRLIVDGNRARAFGDRAGERNPFDVAMPWRWTIDLISGAVSGRQIAGFNCEFPRINDRYQGRRHRYGYYAANEAGGYSDDWLFDGLAKLDVDTGRAEFQTMGGQLTAPGEAVFAPRTGSAAEDDGYVLAIWWDPRSDRSELVVQDAQNFAGPAVARVKIPGRIPVGFHGNWAAA